MGRMKRGNKGMNLRLPPEIASDIKEVSKQQNGRSFSSLVATAWQLARAQIVGDKQAVQS